MTTWHDVLQQLLASPPGSRLTFARGDLGHPAEAGAVASSGLPAPGKLEDWRFAPTANCQGLHVHEHTDRWVAHLDEVHPACDPVEHLRVDAPAIFVTAAAALGATFGALFRGALGGIIGAAIGGVAGGLLAIPGRR